MVTKMRTNERPPWVWTALALQLVLVLLAFYGCIEFLRLMTRYAGPGIGMQILFRDLIPGIMATTSLIGLWRTRRWGWWLALLTDGALCLQTLWFLLNYPTAVLKYPQWFAFSIWQFAALILLLYRPVREYFGESSREHQTAGKPLRLVVYYAAAVISTCVVTAFSLAVMMGPKNGGVPGFLLFLYFGLITGSVAAFLFALLLTALARKLAPLQLWPWLLLGASLPPFLTFVLSVLGIVSGGLGNAILGGPQMLLRIWWLTPAIGVVTGWICYTMYPWCLSVPKR